MEGDLEWFERNYSHLDVEIVRDVFHSVGPDPDAVIQNLKMLVRASQAVQPPGCQKDKCVRSPVRKRNRAENSAFNAALFIILTPDSLLSFPPPHPPSRSLAHSSRSLALSSPGGLFHDVFPSS